MNVIAIILLLTTIEQLAVDIYLPSMPAMTAFFATSDTMLQATLSLYLLGFALSPILFGPLCDRFGRRKILLLGLIIYCLCSLVCAMTYSIHVLLLARLLKGVGSGAIVVANQAMVRDSFTGVKLAKVASYMSITWSLVPIISPAIGGYVQHYLGWRANFWLISTYGLITLILLLGFLHESMQSRPVKLDLKLIIKRYSRLLANQIFMAYVACTSITFAITIAFITAAPFLFQQRLGLSPVAFGWLALAVGGSYLIGILANNFLLSFFSVRQLLVVGQVMMLVCATIMLTLALSGQFTLLSVSLPASGVILFEGLVYPNAAALAFDPITKHTGIASALYGGIQLLACAFISALMAQLPENSALPLSLVIFSLCCLLTVIYYLATKSIRTSNESES